MKETHKESPTETKTKNQKKRNLLKGYGETNYGVKKVLENLLENKGINDELRTALINTKNLAWKIFIQNEGEPT